MLEADTNSERNMTICHSIEPKFTLYCKLYDEKGRTVQRTLDKFIMKNKML